MSTQITPLILCLGDGHQLWPLSEDGRPLALIELIDGLSPLQIAASTCHRHPAFAAPWVAGALAQAGRIEAQLADAGIVPGMVLIEPAPRGAAMIAGIAALALLDRDPDAVLLILPGERLMADDDALGQLLASAATTVFEGQAICLGAAQDCLLVRADSLLAGLAHAAPDIAREVRKSLDAAGRRGLRLYPEPKSYAQAPHGGLEPVAAALPTAAAGEDLALPSLTGWAALYAALSRDEAGNALQGDASAPNSRDCLIYSRGPRVLVAGLEGLAVIASPSTVLVVPRNRDHDPHCPLSSSLP